MSQPRKSDKKYPGYLEDQNRKPFKPTTREEALLQQTLHPEEFYETTKVFHDSIDKIEDRLETLEVRFNELCGLLHVQLANSSFLTLKIMEAEK